MRLPFPPARAALDIPDALQRLHRTASARFPGFQSSGASPQSFLRRLRKRGHRQFAESTLSSLKSNPGPGPCYREMPASEPDRRSPGACFCRIGSRDDLHGFRPRQVAGTAPVRKSSANRRRAPIARTAGPARRRALFRPRSRALRSKSEPRQLPLAEARSVSAKPRGKRNSSDSDRSTANGAGCERAHRFDHLRISALRGGVPARRGSRTPSMPRPLRSPRDRQRCGRDRDHPSATSDLLRVEGPSQRRAGGRPRGLRRRDGLQWLGRPASSRSGR